MPDKPRKQRQPAGYAMKAKTRKPRPLICKVIRCRFTCQEYAQMIEHLSEEHGLVIRDGIDSWCKRGGRDD